MRTKLSPLISVKQEPADAVLDSTAAADDTAEQLMLIVNRQRVILQAHRQIDDEPPNHNRHNNHAITNAATTNTGADIDSNNNTRSAVESRYPQQAHQNSHHTAHWPAKSMYHKILEKSQQFTKSLSKNNYEQYCNYADSNQTLYHVRIIIHLL